MPTRFETEDLRVSNDADRLHGEPVNWHPMSRPPGGAYTADQITSDPGRPVVEGVTAIVSWAPTITSATGRRMGNALNTGSAIASIACIVDFARSRFAGGAMPRRGDLIEVPGEPPDTRWLEVLRMGNATANRITFHCGIAGSHP